MTKTEISKRDNTLDVLKGIGIWFVILGHMFIPDSIKFYVFSFHMPLFFIITGILYNHQKYEKCTVREFLKDGFKKYIRMYIFFAILIFLFDGVFVNALKVYLDKSEGLSVLITQNFLGLLFTTMRNNWITAGGSIWFLMSLFWSRIFVFLILKHIKKDIFRVGVATLIVLLGYLLSYFNIIQLLPWSIGTSLITSVFVLLGFYLKQYGMVEKIRTLKLTSLIPMTIIFFLTNIVYLQYRNVELVKFARYDFGNIFVILLTSLTAFVVLYQIAIPLKESKILKFYGLNSLIIFAFMDCMIVQRVGKIIFHFIINTNPINILFVFIVEIITAGISTIVFIKVLKMCRIYDKIFAK